MGKTEPPPSKPEADIMEKAVLKFDHFENIHRLVEAPVVIEGAPNFRKAPDFPVFGCGQPTCEALTQVLNHVTKQHNTRRVLWMMLRQEPVIYINGVSYTPRHPGHLNENMEFPNATPNELNQLQDDLVHSVQNRLIQNKNVVSYFRDTYAEHPDDRKNIEYSVKTVGPTGVLTTSGMTEFCRALGFDIHFERFPIVDEKAPAFSDFDGILRLICAEPSGTACLFNCQMGKGRTTTGMVIACLIYNALSPSPPSPPTTTTKTAKNTPLEISGNFSCVQKLLKLHANMGKAKEELDGMIEECGPPNGLQNLRGCIMWTKEKFDAEPEHKKSFWKRMSRNFMQRYLTLICFALYLQQQPPRNAKKSFVNWMDENKKMKTLCLQSFDDFDWA